jgi:predicted MFS family arabinose efflux permease
VLQGLVSPWVGRAVDDHGGKPVMVIGSVVLAVSLAMLAASHEIWLYYAAWLVMGVGMRMTLYDAAFAALARIGGPMARRPISQITLLGGLASTVFWPIGHGLADAFGWRGATFIYAGIALLTVAVHWPIPSGRYQHEPLPRVDANGTAPHPTQTARSHSWLAAALYTLVVTFATFLNSGMSALMIGMLASMGVGAGLAVWIGTLRGVGQSLARLCEILFGKRVDPLGLGVFATGLLPVCFICGLFSGKWIVAGIVFAFVYGAGNGLVTIVRGTAPLVLFDPRVYGSLVGRLIVPSFFFSALAPLLYALVIERWGDFAALHLSTAVSLIIFIASVILWAKFRK